MAQLRQLDVTSKCERKTADANFRGRNSVRGTESAVYITVLEIARTSHTSKHIYEVCSKNTRTEIIKNVLYLEVTCLDPLQSTLLPNAHVCSNDISTS